MSIPPVALNRFGLQHQVVVLPQPILRPDSRSVAYATVCDVRQILVRRLRMLAEISDRHTEVLVSRSTFRSHFRRPLGRVAQSGPCRVVRLRSTAADLTAHAGRVVTEVLPFEYTPCESVPVIAGLSCQQRAFPGAFPSAFPCAFRLTAGFSRNNGPETSSLGAGWDTPWVVLPWVATPLSGSRYPGAPTRTFTEGASHADHQSASEPDPIRAPHLSSPGPTPCSTSTCSNPRCLRSSGTARRSSCRMTV